MDPEPQDETQSSSSLGVVTHISNLVDSDDQRCTTDPFSIEPSHEENLFSTISSQDMDASKIQLGSPQIKHSTPNTSGTVDNAALENTSNLKLTKDDDPSFEIFQDEPSYTRHIPKIRRRMTLKELRDKEARNEFEELETLRELRSQEEEEERTQRRYGATRPKETALQLDKTFAGGKTSENTAASDQTPSNSKLTKEDNTHEGKTARKDEPPKIYLAFVYVGANGVRKVAYNSNLPNPDISSLGLETMEMDTFGTMKNLPKPRHKIMSKNKKSCNFCNMEIHKNAKHVVGTNHAKCELEAIISSMDKGPSSKKMKMSED